MRTYLFLAFAFGLLNAKGQTGYMQVRTLSSGIGMCFPVVEHPSDTSVSARINDFLQLALLEKLVRPGDASPFSEATHDPGTLYGGLYSITFRVTTNTAKIFSLSFDMSSSGMTSHYWSLPFMFNAATGELIHADDLFTAAGKTVFMRRATKRMTAQADAVFADLDTAQRHQLSGWYDAITEGDMNLLYIERDRLFLDRFANLSKSEQFAGDGKPLISYSPQELEPYLSAYGKAVMNLTPDSLAMFRSNSIPQLWTGCVDEQYQILFVLRSDPYEWHGVYCYARYGIGLDIVGDKTNNAVILTERDSSLKNTAEIRGKLDKDGFNGTWSELPVGRKLSFAAWPILGPSSITAIPARTEKRP